MLASHNLPKTVKYTVALIMFSCCRPSFATQANLKVLLFSSEARTIRLDQFACSLCEDGPMNIPRSFAESMPSSVFKSRLLTRHSSVLALTVQLKVAFVPSGADVLTGASRIS